MNYRDSREQETRCKSGKRSTGTHKKLGRKGEFEKDPLGQRTEKNSGCGRKGLCEGESWASLWPSGGRIKDVTTGKSREIFQRQTEEPETHMRKGRMGESPELDREVEAWDGGPQSGV